MKKEDARKTLHGKSPPKQEKLRKTISLNRFQFLTLNERLLQISREGGVI
jgi:hypothetical protein